MVKIHTAGTAFEADQIQALLKSYDIPCIIKNDVSNVFTGACSIGYQDVYVNNEQELLAREILREVPIVQCEMPVVSTKKRLFARIILITIIAAGVAVALLGELL